MPDSYVFPFFLVVQGIESDYVYRRYNGDVLFSEHYALSGEGQRKGYADRLRVYFENNIY